MPWIGQINNWSVLFPFRMYHMFLFVPSKLLVVHVECPGQSLPLLSPSMKAPNSSPRLCHFSNPLKNCWYKPLYISIWSLVKKYSQSTSVSVCACLKESSLTTDLLFVQEKVITIGYLKKTKHNRVALRNDKNCFMVSKKNNL